MPSLLEEVGELPATASTADLFVDGCDCILLKKENGSVVIYRITPCTASYSEYKRLIETLSLKVPEAWRPDGGVVAKFRDEDGTTVFVVPKPGETARAAIIRAMNL